MVPYFEWQYPARPALDKDGRVQPLNVNREELANRILTVGDPNRAYKLSTFLDADTPVIKKESSMIFTVYTGKYHGVPVSIVATGMGFAMIELLIVQARTLLEGPIYMIRFGTCGSLHADVPVGCFAVSKRAFAVRQEFENPGFPYEVTDDGIPLDDELTTALFQEFKEKLPDYRTELGDDFSADTFYGSQGREDDSFNNENEAVIDQVLKTDPEALSFQMETYFLAFLSQKVGNTNLKTAAVCLTLAQRTSGDFLDNDRKYAMEISAGQTILGLLSKQ